MRYTTEVTQVLDTVLDAQSRFAGTRGLLSVLDDYLRNTAETSVEVGTLRRMREARLIVEQLRANESAASDYMAKCHVGIINLFGAPARVPESHEDGVN